MKLEKARWTRFSLIITAALYSFGQQVQASSIDQLKELSLEEFAELDVVVTSLSRKPQKLMDSAAAIHVISNADIKRSGATSIPEALRLAPGIEVAQIDSTRWAVTSRGFNGLFARKLLVLMDGRTVYSPVFSGVLWDVQDTLLEDIDRIEVIRGPATAVWGGNAMNGVINIITKSARETQGGLAVVSVGNEVKGQTALRYGDKIGEDFHYRLYGKYKKNDSSTDVTDSNGAYDENSLNQIGFRADWTLSEANYLEFQGDAYKGDFEQEQRVALLSPTIGLTDVSRQNENSGFNFISKWQHQQSETSSWTLQAFLTAPDVKIQRI